MSCGYLINTTWLAAGTINIQDTGIEDTDN